MEEIKISVREDGQLSPSANYMLVAHRAVELALASSPMLSERQLLADIKRQIDEYLEIQH